MDTRTITILQHAAELLLCVWPFYVERSQSVEFGISLGLLDTVELKSTRIQLIKFDVSAALTLLGLGFLEL